jgi:hypothetical protein
MTALSPEGFEKLQDRLAVRQSVIPPKLAYSSAGIIQILKNLQ